LDPDIPWVFDFQGRVDDSPRVTASGGPVLSEVCCWWGALPWRHKTDVMLKRGHLGTAFFFVHGPVCSLALLGAVGGSFASAALHVRRLCSLATAQADMRLPQRWHCLSEQGRKRNDTSQYKTSN
jgi:hypothetical protein